MSELREDDATFVVDRSCDIAPAFNLSLGEQAGDIDEANRIRAHPCGFREDQTRGGPLPVILHLQFVRDVSGVGGSAPRHRCHDDAVFEFARAELEGSKEGQDTRPFSPPFD